MSLDRKELQRRAKALEWLLLDVDGVLTDGRLYYGPHGQQLQSFDIHDGLGLKLAQRAGLRVGLLSGRASLSVAQRARELQLDVVLTGRREKGAALEEFLRTQDVSAASVAYIGDDLNDLPVMRRCGLAFAPADAVAEVRAAAHRVLERPGGRGAVREMVEEILRARHQWKELLAHFNA